jgi:hypothetical protein
MNNNMNSKIKIKNKVHLDYFVILVLSLAFTGLISFFFKLDDAYTRLFVVFITVVILSVFYETVSKLDIYKPESEIGFTNF